MPATTQDAAEKYAKLINEDDGAASDYDRPMNDKNMFFLALLAKNMRSLPFHEALFKAAIDRDGAFAKWESVATVFDKEKIGMVATQYTARVWIEACYS